MRLLVVAVTLYCAALAAKADPVLTGITYTNSVLTNRLNGNPDGGIRSSSPNTAIASTSLNGSIQAVQDSGNTSQLSASFNQSYKAPDTQLFDSILVDFYTISSSSAGSGSGVGGSISLSEYLKDLTTGSFLGSPQGTLLVGHQYEFYLSGEIDGTNGTASNTGTYTFAFTPTGTAATVTPEPCSLALLGTGVLGMIGLARRRFA